jgi:hypothetical protein
MLLWMDRYGNDEDIYDDNDIPAVIHTYPVNGSGARFERAYHLPRHVMNCHVSIESPVDGSEMLFSREDNMRDHLRICAGGRRY